MSAAQALRQAVVVAATPEARTDAGAGRGAKDATAPAPRLPRSPREAARAAAGSQWGRQGALLAVLLLVTLAFPKDVPLGVYGLGLTSGAALALQAVAIVLVYRSNRIINFAQAAIGAVGAMVFVNSVTYRPALRWLGFLCGDDGCGSRAVAVNYWVSFVLGMLLPVGVAALVYLLVIRRFAGSPRLLLTVATTFVSYALYSLGPHLVDWFSTEEQLEGNRAPIDERTALPFGWRFELGGAVFRLVDVLMVGVAVVLVGGLFVYLRRSALGVAIRATSESPDRAATLGIDVGRTTMRVWLLAGGLSGVASVLGAASSGVGGFGLNLQGFLVLLTAAAIASLTSLPLTLAACVVLGAVQQSTLWAFGTIAPFVGSLVLVLTATFALQRARASRGEIELASSFSTAREMRPVPRELAGLAAVKAWRRSLVTVLVLLFGGSPVLLAPAQVDAVTTLLVMAVVALSLLVLTGWAGQISLGQIGFAGVGAYVAAWSGLPFPLALLVGTLAGAVVAVVVGVPALRLRGLHLAVMSLALSVSIYELGLNPEYAGRFLPADLERPSVLGVDLESTTVFYYFVLVLALLSVAAVVGLRRSRTARALIAARDNELAAQSLGIDLVRARVVAFALSGGLAAAAGAVLAYQQHAVQAFTFAPYVGMTLFMAAVLGGLGHVSGPLLGTALMLGTPMLPLPPLVAVLITGAGSLAIVLAIPGGVAKSLFDLRDSFLRRLARREGIAVPSLLGPDDADAAAPLLPRSETPGADAYVPARYRLPHQWALQLPQDRTAERRARAAGGRS